MYIVRYLDLENRLITNYFDDYNIAELNAIKTSLKCGICTLGLRDVTDVYQYGKRIHRRPFIDATMYDTDIYFRTPFDFGTECGLRYYIVSKSGHYPIAYLQKPKYINDRLMKYINDRLMTYITEKFDINYDDVLHEFDPTDNVYIGWDYGHLGQYPVYKDCIYEGKRYTVDDVYNDIKSAAFMLYNRSDE